MTDEQVIEQVTDAIIDRPSRWLMYDTDIGSTWSTRAAYTRAEVMEFSARPVRRIDD